MQTSPAPRCSPARFSSLALCAVLVLAADPALAQQPLTSTGTRATLKPSGITYRKAVPQVQHDYSGIGGSVYATGLGTVTVSVHHVNDFLAADGMRPYPMAVGLKTAKGQIALGSNYRPRRTSLGIPQRGELLFTTELSEAEGQLISGDGSRHADRLPRSRVRQVRDGVIELYFEGTMNEGKVNDRKEQHWYKDVKITITGAVTQDPGVLILLEQTRSADAVQREAARTALLRGFPSIASQAGIR